MNKVDKFLSKLTEDQREAIFTVLTKIEEKDFSGLDWKKLKDASNTFRVRKGKIRIIYSLQHDGIINLIKVDWRNEKTYRGF